MTGLLLLLGAAAVPVLHAGSTAGPGIDAKPILDIVAGLCAPGAYAYEGDQGDDGGVLFVLGTGACCTVHVHVIGSGSRAPVRQFPGDRLASTRAKGSGIRELLTADMRGQIR